MNECVDLEGSKKLSTVEDMPNEHQLQEKVTEVSNNSLSANCEDQKANGTVLATHFPTSVPTRDQDLSADGHHDRPKSKSKHVCDECGRTFTRSSTLLAQKRIHTGAKPYVCQQCRRAFRQLGNLSRHQLTQTTSKPYVCQKCNKAFNRASNLHTHMRTHFDYKPFCCDFCGKRFHQKIDMKIHRYTHTGEKPHKCLKCGRRLKQLTHLTYHMRTHSEVRMYKCEFCGKGFNQRGIWKRMSTATRVNDRSSATYAVRVSLWHPRWIRIRERTPLISHSTADFARRRSIRRTLCSHLTLHHTPSLEEFLCCKMLLGLELNKHQDLKTWISLAKYFMQILIRPGSWENRKCQIGIRYMSVLVYKRKSLVSFYKTQPLPVFLMKTYCKKLQAM